MDALSDSEFLATAKKRFTQCQEDEKDIRTEAEKDLKFLAGDQWDEQLKTERLNARRPVLTFNRLPTFVQQVGNEARQNKSQIKFAPTDDEATEPTAKVFEGLARHIQYSSSASVAYETAFEYAVGCSFGYYRFMTDYCDDDSFDQELQILPVVDPFSVYGVLMPRIFNRPVPYAYVIQDILKEEYKKLYPKSGMVDANFTFDKPGDWLSGDFVRVAEYWTLETDKKDILLLDDGRVVDASDPAAKDLVIPDERKRTVLTKSVEFCKMNGLEVLEGTKTKWLGSTIPIIPVMGKQLIVAGKPRLFSLVRNLREPQQLINYSKTRIAETLATAPISPFIGALGSFKGREKEWKQINTALTPYVEYNIVDDATGKPLPPPARQTFEPPIASLSEFAAQEVDDLKAISGIFDQSLGEGTNDQSGQAIKRRQQQSNATNAHFIDNLERAMKDGGPVMAELLPLIYGDTARVIKILGEDEEPDIVKVNQEYEEKGQTVAHHLSKGKYDFVVTVGKAFSTKRMESFDMMSEIIGGNPQLMLMIGDIFFKNSDGAGADQMSDRFKKIIQMLHPGLIEDDNEQPIPPQAQAKIAQTTQQLNAMHAYAQQVEGEKQKLEQEKQAKIIDNQFKADMADKDRIAKVTIAEIGAKTQIASERMKWEHEAWKITHTSAHEAATQAVDHQHEAGQLEAQQQAASESQASDQMHQAGMAQQAQEAQPEAGA